MSDTSYRQQRCRHGWVDANQCEDCATATQLAAALRFIGVLNEEFVLRGYPGGDRTVVLENVRSALRALSGITKGD